MNQRKPKGRERDIKIYIYIYDNIGQVIGRKFSQKHDVLTWKI